MRPQLESLNPLLQVSRRLPVVERNDKELLPVAGAVTQLVCSAGALGGQVCVSPKRVILVGKKEVIQAELALHGGARKLPIEVCHASEVVTMDDSAAKAVRTKKDSSMRVACRLHRDGEAQGDERVQARQLLASLPDESLPAEDLARVPEAPR